MSPLRNLTHVVLSAAILVAVGSSTAAAKSPQEKYYKAYYLQHDKGQYQEAADLYHEVMRAKRAGAELKRHAEDNLFTCREELATQDLAKLAPPEALVYAELNRPGKQIAQLLDALGLLASDSMAAKTVQGKHVAITPALLNEVFGLRGVAVAITGFDPQQGMPSGVAIVHPGNIEIIRAAAESALPAVATQTQPIGRYPVYVVEDQIHVCLLSRMVVISTDRSEIEAVVRRLAGNDEPSLATNPQVKDLLAERRGAMAFVCLNAKKAMPLIAACSAGDPDFARMRAMLDLDSLNWVVGRFGIEGNGVFADLAVSLDKGHHNLAYNLVRTPPITRSTLENVPAGAAAFLAGALNYEPQQPSRTQGDQAPRPITGLELGREIFANIVDFAVFAMPPGDKAVSGPPIPNVAAVLRVKDPAQSEALWMQILGIASLAAGAPTMDGTSEEIAGTQVRAYKFPAGPVIYFATSQDKILVSCTKDAMRQTIEAARSKQSVLQDAAFADSLSKLPTAAKALFVHPGRCFEIGKPFMSAADRQKAEPFIALCSRTVASILTHESEDRLQLSAAVTGLPDVGALLAQVIQLQDKKGKLHKDTRKAIRQERWDDALAAVDQLIELEPQRLEHQRSKFKILATGLKDHDATLACGQTIFEKAGRNARVLNNLAWALLTDDQYEHGYDELAVRMAGRANALTDHQSWAFLDTLALAKFETGDVDAAIEVQEKAIEFRGQEDEALQRSLQRYKAVKSEVAHVSEKE